MKIHHLIVRSFCLFFMIAFSALRSAAQDSASLKAVGEAVEQLRTAMISADSTTLDKLTDAGLSYGHSGGQLQNKQEFIHGITGGNSVFTSIDLSSQTITITKNTAIVRHILSAATNDKGKGPGNVKLSVLLVWIKTGKGAWKLLARQAVKVV